jgi:hypothetical protein
MGVNNTPVHITGVIVTSEFVTVLLPSLDIKKPLCWEGDIFFPKIILLDSGDYTPKLTI